MLSSSAYSRFLHLFPLLATFFTLSSASALDGVPPSLEQSVDLAVQHVKPALVRILVVSTHYSDGREMKSESSGSGVIINEEGYIVTNHHVAGHAVRLFCTLSTKEEIEATLVGTDPLSDIAVIKLKEQPGRKYPVVQFGDSETVQVGDYVLAMGSPMALSQSVTLGIVSNTEMVMPEFFEGSGGFTLDGEDVGSMVLWLGHDAAIYGGNSGGPLVNLEGEIIGINEISFGLGGAIPGNLARDVANQLIENGKVQRSWLGFGFQPRLKSDSAEKGLLISGVIKQTPAESAGFETGDRLIRLASQEVDLQFKEQIPLFNRFVSDLPAGKEIEAAVVRDGEEVVLKITPMERDSVEPKELEFKQWGITASDISFFKAREMKRESQEGVLVTSVRTGGPAGEAKPGLRRSDILTTLDGVPIKNLEALSEFTAKLTEGAKAPKPVVTGFERDTSDFMTVVKVGVKDSPDPGLEVKKAWIPVETQVVTTDLGGKLGLEGKKGVRVTRIFPHPEFTDPPIKVGDVILELDGKEIEASEPEHSGVFPTMIRQYKVGSTANLTIRRGTEELKADVKLLESPKLAREMKKHEDLRFEFSTRDIAYYDKAEQEWDLDQSGVLVTEVVSGGWAAIGNVHVNDLVLEINGKRITNVVELEKELNAVVEQRPTSVVFLVRRGIHQRYLELQPDWESAKF